MGWFSSSGKDPYRMYGKQRAAKMHKANRDLVKGYRGDRAAIIAARRASGRAARQKSGWN